MARLNKQRNLKLTAPIDDDLQSTITGPALKELFRENTNDSYSGTNSNDGEGKAKLSVSRSVMFSNTVTSIQETVDDSSEFDFSEDDDIGQNEARSVDNSDTEDEETKSTKDGKKGGIKGIFKRLRAKSIGEFSSSINSKDKEDKNEKEEEAILSIDDDETSEDEPNRRKASQNTINDNSSKKKIDAKRNDTISELGTKRRKSGGAIEALLGIKRDSDSISSENSEQQESKEKRQKESKYDSYRRGNMAASPKLGFASLSKMFGRKNAAMLKAELADTRQVSATLNEGNLQNTDSNSDNNGAIIVLKVFSGNYDFKATYKTVAVTKTTTVNEALKLALVRFKVPGAVSFKQAQQAGFIAPVPSINSASVITEDISVGIIPNVENSYYLSVVHGDSKEKKLHPNDRILDVLFKLQTKSAVPGVAQSSQKEFIKHMKYVTSRGKVSSIRTPNDSEIKFLINLKSPSNDDFAVGNSLLIRVYLFGDHFNSGTLHSAKTIVAESSATVRDVVGKAIQKFKIHKMMTPEKSSNFNLWKAKENLVLLTSSDSNVNLSVTNHTDPFSLNTKAIRTVIQPDSMIPKDIKLGDYIRSVINDGGELEDQPTFVLKEEDSQDTPSEAASKTTEVSIIVAKSEPDVALSEDNKPYDSHKSLPSVPPKEEEALDIPKIKISNSKNSVFLSQSSSAYTSVSSVSPPNLPETVRKDSRSSAASTIEEPSAEQMPTDLALALNVISPSGVMDRKKGNSSLRSPESPINSILAAYSNEDEGKDKVFGLNSHGKVGEDSPLSKRKARKQSSDKSISSPSSRRASEDLTAKVSKLGINNETSQVDNTEEINYLMAFLGTTNSSKVTGGKRVSVSTSSVSSSSSGGDKSIQKHDSSLTTGKTNSSSKLERLDNLMKSIEQLRNSEDLLLRSNGSSLADISESNSSSQSEDLSKKEKRKLNGQSSLSNEDRSIKIITKRKSLDDGSSEKVHNQPVVGSTHNKGSLPGSPLVRERKIERTQSAAIKAKELRNFFESKGTSDASSPTFAKESIMLETKKLEGSFEKAVVSLSKTGSLSMSNPNLFGKDRDRDPTGRIPIFRSSSRLQTSATDLDGSQKEAATYPLYTWGPSSGSNPKVTEKVNQITQENIETTSIEKESIQQ